MKIFVQNELEKKLVESLFHTLNGICECVERDAPPEDVISKNLEIHEIFIEQPHLLKVEVSYFGSSDNEDKPFDWNE
jgi:hypothetical protein